MKNKFNRDELTALDYTNTENSASDFARSSRDKAYPAMISGPSCFMLSTGGKNETADTADN